MNFYEKLANFLHSKGYTNKELGEILGYSPAMIGRYLKDQNPNYEFIKKVQEVFDDVDWNYLFKDNMSANEEEEPYKKPPKVLLNEIEVRVKELKQWHNNDTENI